MEVHPDDLRAFYKSLSDEALQAMKREELVEIAQDCYDQELANRGFASRKAASGEPAKVPIPLREPVYEIPPDGKGMVEVSTFASLQEGGFAHSMLVAAGIPVFVERERVTMPALHLKVPPEFLKEAREVLAAPISEEDLTAQAEAEPPPDDI